MELFYISFGIVVGWVVGRMYMIYELRHTIQFLKNKKAIVIEYDLEKMLEEEEGVTPLYIIENHGSTFYLFDQVNDKFICQAKSIEDLAKSFYNIVSIKKALIKHNEDFFVFIEGKTVKLEHYES